MSAGFANMMATCLNHLIFSSTFSLTGQQRHKRALLLAAWYLFAVMNAGQTNTHALPRDLRTTTHGFNNKALPKALT